MQMSSHGQILLHMLKLVLNQNLLVELIFI